MTLVLLAASFFLHTDGGAGCLGDWTEFAIEAFLLLSLSVLAVALFRKEQAKRDHAWKALQAFEARREALIKFSPVGIFTADSNGGWGNVNLSMARLYGCASGAELKLYRPCLWDFYGPEVSEKIQQAVLSDVDCLHELESEITRMDGTLSWLSSSIRVVRDQFGLVERYEGFILDISPRKRSLMAFHERAGFVQNLFDSIPNPIVCVSVSGAVYDYNKEFYDFFEPEHPDLKDRSVDEIVPQKVVEEIRKMISLVVSRREVLSRELSFENRFHNEVNILLTCSGHISGKGDVLGAIFLFIDITECKRLEKNIRRAEEKYRSIYRNSPIGLFRVTVGGRLLEANPVAARMFNYDELFDVFVESRNVNTLYADPAQRRELVAAALSASGYVEREVTFHKRGSSSFIGKVRVRVADNLPGGEAVLEGTIEDITASKVADHALRDAEKNYRSIVENALHGIIRATPDGLVLSCNPAALEVLGFKDFVSLKKQVSNFWTWVFKEHDFYTEFMRQVLGGVDITGVEAELVRNGGEAFWGHLKARFVADTYDDLDFIYMFFADITHRKIVRSEIQKSEETANALINAPSDIIFLMDGDGNILKSNKKAVEVFGIVSGEPLSRRFGELWEGICADVNFRADTASQGREGMKNGAVDHDGRFYVYQIIPVSISGGFAGNVAVYLRDTTEQKLAEMNLVASEARYRRLFEDSVLGIFKADTGGRIETVNPAYARMFGYASPDEFIADIQRGSAEGGIVLDRTLLGADGNREFGPMVVQRDFMRRDKSEFVGNLHVWPVRDQENRVEYYEGFVEDITELVNAEKQARTREEQLIQADKMISLGILTAGVAHEINNPNHLITLNTPIIKEAWDSLVPVLDEYVQENGDILVAGMPYEVMRDNVSVLLSGIEEGAERIKKIVSDMKDFARPESSVLMEDVDVNSVINAALTLLSNKIKKTTDHFSLELGQVALVRGNYQRLEQVFVNLVLNALEATRSKDKSIVVRTGHDPVQNMVRVEISDQGSGISKKDIKRIFDPFFTTKREHGGIGLGLCISLSIVKAHGGKLEFASNPGDGTVATLYLPSC